MPRKARYGRIRILGPGGVFLKLDDAEQRVVNAADAKQARSDKAKQKFTGQTLKPVRAVQNPHRAASERRQLRQ